MTYKERAERAKEKFESISSGYELTPVDRELLRRLRDGRPMSDKEKGANDHDD